MLIGTIGDFKWETTFILEKPKSKKLLKTGPIAQLGGAFDW